MKLNKEMKADLKQAREKLDWDWIAYLLVPESLQGEISKELQRAYLSGCKEVYDAKQKRRIK